MASQVELSSNIDITQQLARSNKIDANAIFGEMQRFSALASDNSADRSAELKSSAGVINATVANLQQAAKNGDQSAAALLSKVQSGMSTLNSSLYGLGSDLRLTMGANGVQMSSVNLNGNPTPSASSQSQDWNAGLTQDSTGPGFDLNGQADPSVTDSPLFAVIKQAVEDVVKQVLTGSGSTDDAAQQTADSAQQNAAAQQQGGDSASSNNVGGSGGNASSSTGNGQAASSSNSGQSAASSNGGGQPAATSSSSGGQPAATSSSSSRDPLAKRSSEELGNGSEAMSNMLSDNLTNMFLDAMKKSADQKNGKQANQKGGKGKAGAANAANGANGANANGVGNQQQAGGLGGLLGGGTTGGQQAGGTDSGFGAVPNGQSGPGNPGTTGVTNGDNFPISNAGGGNVPNDAGAAGDPMLCNANINGILMMVLLECYKDGQKDLLAQAQRMQDINNQKKGIRDELAADRQQLVANPNDKQASANEQNHTDQLQSLGDDSQMMQLNLQNMAQNQQQLLQMISNFSKNTHDNSMAIIRHIGGG